MRVWVGIDDTDSSRGMCTTYLATLIMERVESELGRVEGFPRLIRLNPTIPYKTRGNGAVSFLVDVEDREDLMEVVNEVVLEHAMIEDENTDPGVVFVDDDLALKLKSFADRAMKDVVMLDEALFLIGKYFIPHLKYKKGRGLIGALAAVGAELNDHTLELIAYRYPEKFGTEREYDEESFFDMDFELYPLTFDNVDWCNEKVVCIPNTPCPVLYGLRGESVEALYDALDMIRTEPYDRKMIFITNHATDMHIIDTDRISITGLENYRSYKVTGRVTGEPYDIEGGHVFFEIDTRFGEIKCAAFEPTKQFRNIIRQLRPGDEVEVYGSMKKDTINLEKIRIVKLAKVYVERNPICAICGKRMESAGKGQGFRCRKCKTRASRKVKELLSREIETGFYEVPPSARRHLSRPLIRMDGDKRHIFR
ncbi:tRNA(Ile)(2)-agmatinylcytidine synthase [Archaeoglobus neptunius]|uniref:tRNA(Ile)(2)-agmatinylcytidine synthase n=1 Tax=Archaeoglobus neptunius TaxID=2798580 RepID=UPI00192662B9|nr:tRNA(Ile)(2)-agmatinylcytidine synthase [Archaeoglobus neptunius]